MRDVVQNHLLQVLALVAMEPPTGEPARTRSATRSSSSSRRCRRPTRSATCAASTSGYRDIDGVADDSETETYAALELEVDNWRWSGVPFFIRAGKHLPVKHTEVTAVFKRPPPIGVGSGPLPEPNQMTIRIDPQPGARINIFAKKAGEEAFDPADLEVLFDRQEEDIPEPYERLLDDAIAGQTGLFVREVGIEETWRIVQPLLDDPPPVETYEPGSWGPASADKLTRGVCRWYDPWLPR